MSRWSGLEVKRGWFVRGEGSADIVEAKAEWFQHNPDFVEWDQNWFEEECRHAYVAENEGSQGEPLILFHLQEVAEKYAKRDWIIASGRGRIIPVLYLELELNDDWDEDADEYEVHQEHKWDLVFGPGGLACLGDKEIVVLEDSEESRQAIRTFAVTTGIPEQAIGWSA